MVRPCAHDHSTRRRRSLGIGIIAVSIALVLPTHVVAAEVKPAAAGPSVSWTRQFGSSQFDDLVALATDRAGNTTAAGSTSGAFAGKVAKGRGDVFVRSYAPNGKIRWTRQFGSSGFDTARGVAVDSKGNVVVAGSTEGSLLGPTNGGSDAWVRKYSPTGTVLWSRQFGTTQNDQARDVAVDGGGNVYVVGETSGSLRGANAGGADAFIRKYAPGGKLRWTRQFGTSGQDLVEGAAADDKGNAWVIGGTDGALAVPNQGDFDAFVRKYRSDGNVRWTQQIGTTGSDFATGGIADEDGFLYLVGGVEGSISGQVHQGNVDIFVLKLAPGGDERWARLFGTSANEFAGRPGIDPRGAVHVAGFTNGTLAGQTSRGQADAVIRVYRPDGRPRWTRQFGTAQDESVAGVAVDAVGNAYVGGNTEGSFGIQANGMGDAYIRRYAP